MQAAVRSIEMAEESGRRKRAAGGWNARPALAAWCRQRLEIQTCPSRLPTSKPPAASSRARCCARPCCRRRGCRRSPAREVYVKYENLQVTNSFKDRGALVKLASLGEAERKRGVIAMSAGNHAQAVAYHAARLGIPATIVMPVTTPFVKVAATRSHGAEVVLDGESVAEARAALRRDPAPSAG